MCVCVCLHPLTCGGSTPAVGPHPYMTSVIISINIITSLIHPSNILTQRMHMDDQKNKKAFLGLNPNFWENLSFAEKSADVTFPY